MRKIKFTAILLCVTMILSGCGSMNNTTKGGLLGGGGGAAAGSVAELIVKHCVVMFLKFCSQNLLQRKNISSSKLCNRDFNGIFFTNFEGFVDFLCF